MAATKAGTTPDRSSGRRPGPRVDVDVPAHVLDVAERLFADHGIGNVSLRAVAREADVAPAAVIYHFVNKQELVAAVVERRDVVVGPEVRRRLTEVAEDERDVGVRALVDAVLLPFVQVIESDSPGGLCWVKIISRLALTDDPIFRAMLDRPPDLNECFASASARVLPDQDAATTRRLGLAIYSVITALASADLLGYGQPLRNDGRLDPEFVEQLALFASAGITLG